MPATRGGLRYGVVHGGIVSIQAPIVAVRGALRLRAPRASPTRGRRGDPVGHATGKTGIPLEGSHVVHYHLEPELQGFMQLTLHHHGLLQGCHGGSNGRLQRGKLGLHLGHESAEIRRAT